MVTEEAWRANLERAMHDCRWTFAHIPPSRVVDRDDRSRDYTLTTAPRGFPDLVAFRRGHLLVIETKKPGAYPTPHQRLWLEEAHLIIGARVWVSRPTDPWDQLAQWIMRPATAPCHFGWEPAGVEDARRRIAAGASALIADKARRKARRNR